MLTTDPVIKKEQSFLGTSVVSKHNIDHMCFGLETVWVGREKVMFSDPHKTIVDVLATPWIGGGIQHVEECLASYLSGEHYDPIKLVEYAQQQNNGAVFKRLGFLLSKLNQEPLQLIQTCLKNLTKGKVKLDPHMNCTKLVTKWKLWIPENYRVSAND